MPADHVLRVPRDGSTSDDAVLINVYVPEKDSNALQIEGTEGEMPYVGYFSAKSLAASRSKSSPIPASDWTATLAHLLQHKAPPPLPTPSPTLSLGAELNSSKSLTIHLRQTIAGGISQRLGALELSAAPEHEIDTLAWTAAAVIRSDELAAERDSASNRIIATEERANGLAAQLEELVHARKLGEDAMLLAFVDVLNEKKRKIRELQRCVEVLKVGGGKKNIGDCDEESREEPEGKGKDVSRKPGVTRRPKRKANSDGGAETDLKAGTEGTRAGGTEEDDSDASGSFERMRSPGADRGESTADESEDDQPEPPLPAFSKRSVGIVGGRSKAVPKTPVNEESSASREAQVKPPPEKQADAPPRRDLPFTRPQNSTRLSDNLMKRGDDDGDGNETSDDEL